MVLKCSNVIIDILPLLESKYYILLFYKYKTDCKQSVKQLQELKGKACHP